MPMPTLTEKAAINKLIEFLLNEFATEAAINAAISNILEIVSAIKQDYQPTWNSWLDLKGILDRAWVGIKPEHLKELKDFYIQIEDIQKQEFFDGKGHKALSAVVNFFENSCHWSAGWVSTRLAVKPIIPLNAAINYRIASSLIDKSALVHSSKLKLIEDLSLLDSKEVANYFYHEIRNAILQKSQMPMQITEQTVMPNIAKDMLLQYDSSSSVGENRKRSSSASPTLGSRERRNSDYRYLLID